MADEKFDDQQEIAPSGRLSSINMDSKDRLMAMTAGSLLTAVALTRRGPIGLASAVAGGKLIYSGIKGESTLMAKLGINHGPKAMSASVPHIQNSKDERSIIINKPRWALYEFWRDPANLAKVMDNIESVESIGDNRYLWTMKTPTGPMHWEAEVFRDIKDELIAWRSVGGGIENAGSVRFSDAVGGRGTKVDLVLSHQPPMGRIGAVASKLMSLRHITPSAALTLKQVKQYLEAGAVMSSELRPGLMASHA